jgi:polar amino acid transport system substrate-binding protein
MQFGPPGTPDFRGFEVDLLAALAAALEWTLEYRVALWSELLDRLAHGRVDLLCTAATVTPERASRFAFGQGYLATGLVQVTRARTGPGGHPANRVAVRAATVAEEWASAHLPEATLIRFHLNTEAYQALRQGEVDALVDDEPIARFFVSAAPGLRIVTACPDTAAEYAIVFARGNEELRMAMDGVLREMIRSGGTEELRRKWLGA